MHKASGMCSACSSKCQTSRRAPSRTTAGIAVAACFLCISCAKPSKTQQMEMAIQENQVNVAEVQQRVSSLENRLDVLAGNVQRLDGRTYEVRNSAGRKTGMSVHPVVPVAPRASAPPVVTTSTETVAVAAASSKKTAPLRTWSEVEKEAKEKANGNAVPVLSLPPETIPQANVPQNAQRSQEPKGKVVLPRESKDAKPSATPTKPVTPAAILALPPEGAANSSATYQNPSANPSVPKSGAEKMPPAAKGEEGAYKSALQLVLAGKADEGRKQFNEFLSIYPAGRFAANAYYWIGESFYSQGNYSEALISFKQVSTQFPTHHKTADALLKAGMTYQKLGDKDNAQLQYKALLADFPTSEAAKRIRGKVGR